MKKEQANFRFDAGTKAVLKRAARESGLSETQVVETCIAKYALEVPALAQEAQEVFTRVMAENLGKGKSKKKTT